MADDGPQRGNGGAPSRVNFDYIKSQYYRVIHMDGAIGSVTPNGHIHMSLYSERLPIPRRTVFPLENDRLGEENPNERIVRDAVIREMDVDVIMTAETAKNLSDWLETKIKEVHARRTDQKTQEAKND